MFKFLNWACVRTSEKSNPSTNCSMSSWAQTWYNRTRFTCVPLLYGAFAMHGHQHQHHHRHTASSLALAIMTSNANDEEDDDSNTNIRRRSRQQQTPSYYKSFASGLNQLHLLCWPGPRPQSHQHHFLSLLAGHFTAPAPPPL